MDIQLMWGSTEQARLPKTLLLLLIQQRQTRVKWFVFPALLAMKHDLWHSDIQMFHVTAYRGLTPFNHTVPQFLNKLVISSFLVDIEKQCCNCFLMFDQQWELLYSSSSSRSRRPLEVYIYNFPYSYRLEVCMKRNLRFSVLSNDALTCHQNELGIQSTNWAAAASQKTDWFLY